VTRFALSASTRFFHSARTWRATALPSIIFAVIGTPAFQSKRGQYLYDSRAKTDYDEQQHAHAHQSVARKIELACALLSLGTRCIFIDVPGDFDTHSRQIKLNREEYTRLGLALAAFHTDLGREMDRVLVMVISEFGRAVYESGAEGTDHGTGGAMLLFGGGVKGGRVHGEWPGLEKKNLLWERDLAVTTDFRDAFAEVAQQHLKLGEVSTLFPGYTPGPGPGVVG
jgi:uncharacterized protein (DUF1501 family)